VGALASAVNFAAPSRNRTTKNPHVALIEISRVALQISKIGRVHSHTTFENEVSTVRSRKICRYRYGTEPSLMDVNKIFDVGEFPNF